MNHYGLTAEMRARGIRQETEERIRVLVREMSEGTNVSACFRSIFRAIPDAAVFADLNRRILMINPALETVFGYREEELLGRETEILYTGREEYLEQGRIRFNLKV